MGILDRFEEINIRTEDVFVIQSKDERRFFEHLHKRHQLTYIEGGVAYLDILGKQYLVPSKHFFWIPAGVVHRLRVSHSATVVHCFYIQPNSGQYYNEFGVFYATNLIIELILFCSRWKGKFLNFTDPLGNVVKTLLELVQYESTAKSIQLPFSESPKVSAILNYIDQNFAESLHLSHMTDVFHMSERTFCRLFKRELNTTFLQYLKTVRIVKAIDLLVHTDMSIEEIANKVGYESLSAFSSIFLEYTGHRPQQMRILLQQ